jgi:hypothetical protein
MRITYTLWVLLAAYSTAAQAQSQAPQFTISTVAGNGTAGFTGDGGPATSAEINTPYMAAADSAGNLYIADFNNNRIRKVTPAGVITTVIGTGVAGFSGDNGSAATAQLYRPSSVFFDPGGNLFIADQFNNRVRKVTPTGIITTVAGSARQGYCGDGGPATSACLNGPIDAVTDSSGNLFIAEFGSNAVRKVNASGIITTVAGGNTTGGYSGDGGGATAASLNGPTGVAVSATGDLYVGDGGNERIRRVTGGIITTVAGNGQAGYSGDGGPATAASLNFPGRIRLDALGNLYITDGRNNRIRVVLASDSTIVTVAGNGTSGNTGDGGPATSAEIGAGGLSVTASGSIYDCSINKIRLLAPATPGAVAPTNVLPQLAFGGGWYSALYFTNLSSASVSFPVNLIGDDGNPLTVPSLGSSSTTVTLAPRGTATIALPNSGALVEGYVTVALPAGVTGYGVVRQSVPGIADQEAVVPLSGVTATTSTLLFDETNYITGVAVVNLASANATITVNAHDAQGNPLGSGTISLGPNAKTEAALRNISGLAGIVGNVGSVDFTVTSGNLAVLGLRFDGSAFTSIPTSDK